MLRVSVSIAGSVMLIVAASSQTPRPQGPVCPTLADRFGHDGEGHEWLLNRAELDNREADYREHPLPALKSHRPEG